MQEIAELYQKCRATAKAALDASNEGKNMGQLHAALGAIETWRNFVRSNVDPVTAVGFDAVQQNLISPLSWPIGFASNCYTEYCKMERQINWLIAQYQAGKVNVAVSGNNNRVVASGQNAAQNDLNIGHVENSAIQQGAGTNQSQNVSYEMPPVEDLKHLVALMRAHLGELGLAPEAEKKTKAQLATIEAQLLDEPNPVIIRETGRTLKNITEGAIGSLLATAAQPSVWGAIQSLLTLL